MDVCLVDIGGIVDHHCLNVLLIKGWFVRSFEERWR